MWQNVCCGGILLLSLLLLSLQDGETVDAAGVGLRNDGPPIIKEHPTSVVARRNDPATLNCAATGASRTRWFRNGEEIFTISDDSRSHRVLLPSGTLFFLRVASSRRDSDAGTYWCVASNSNGATRSNNATLTIASLGIEFLNQPRSEYKTTAGDTLRLPCRPPKGSPTPTISWYRDGKQIENSSRVTVTVEGHLIIRNVQDNDSGNYICQASNIVGMRETPSSKVTIMNQNECLEWGFCDQGCENGDVAYKCNCKDGYTLDKDNKRCRITDRSEKMTLYFTNHTEVLKFTPDSGQTKARLVTNSSAASGLDFNFKNNLLYWSDTETKKIYTQKIVGEDENSKAEISLPGSLTPGAIAIDWIGEKIYVVDTLGQNIDVFDDSFHAIVMSNNISEPHDIALDPTKGLMFVADTDRILRANMDGTNIMELVNDFITKASGITVDINSQRIFWCDSLLNSIRTFKYDGTGQHVIVRGPAFVPASNRLTLFESKIYWSDSIKQAVVSVDKYDGEVSVTSVYQAKNISLDLKAIKTVHSLMQPYVKNPCGTNNGGCNHMCIMTHDSTGLGYSCACNIGYRLGPDKKQCSMVTEFLMFSLQKFIKGKLLDPVSESFNDAINPIASKASRFIGLDFDARKEYIYYSDINIDDIRRVKRNGTGGQSLLTIQNEIMIEVRSVEGLALDWASSNLYYVDTHRGSGTLNVLHTEGSFNHHKVLLTNLSRPRALVVHPNRGYVFYSEWNRPANVSRAYLDGTNVMVFKNINFGWPNGLAIDYDTDRIYWCDALLDHIQHANFDGTDVMTVNTRIMKHPISLVIHKDLLFVNDWRHNAILRMNKTDGSDEKIVVNGEESNRLYSVRIYSEQAQILPDTHPCAPNARHGCEKFCFPVPDNSTDNTSGGIKAVCGCPSGEMLDEDGLTCMVDLESKAAQLVPQENGSD